MPPHSRAVPAGFGKEQDGASGLYGSVEEVLDTALACLPNDARFDREHRSEAVRPMIEFGERRKLSLGEPVTRLFLHQSHHI